MKAFPVSLTILPMEARLTDKLPSDGAWQYEPKWDGFRCLAFKINKKVHLLSKSGKPLDRYFPEVVARIASLKASEFVLDGELEDVLWRFFDAQSTCISRGTPKSSTPNTILLDSVSYETRN